MSQPFLDSPDLDVLRAVFDDFCARHNLSQTDKQRVAVTLIERYDPKNVSPEDLISGLQRDHSQSFFQ